MNNWRYIILLLLCIPVYSYSSEDKADSIIRLSGLQAQVESTAELTASSMRRYSLAMTEQAAGKYEKTVDSAYDKGKVFTQFRKSFAGKIKGFDLAGVEKWMSSPLGKKITEMEKKTLTPDGAVEFREYITGPSRPDKKRRELVRRFLKVTSSDAISEKMVCEPLRAMMNSMQARLPDEMKEDDDNFKEGLAEMERESLIEYQMILPDSVAFSYKGLTDDEFSQMLDFYDTDDGRKFNSIVIESMVSALVYSAKECGKGMAELLVEAEKRTGEPANGPNGEKNTLPTKK